MTDATVGALGEVGSFCTSAGPAATGKCAKCATHAGTATCTIYGYATGETALNDDAASETHCNACTPASKILAPDLSKPYGTCTADNTACSPTTKVRIYQTGSTTFYACQAYSDFETVSEKGCATSAYTEASTYYATVEEALADCLSCTATEILFTSGNAGDKGYCVLRS
jgi:hypothetical protein